MALAIKIGFVVVVTALAWFNLAAALIAMAATVLVALHRKAGSLIELSFGPLRAKLERELSEAERLVEKLRRFAAVQARAAVAASAHTGRFASGDDWIFQAAKRIEAALRDLGISEEDLGEVRTDLVRLTLRDLGMSALGGNLVPSKLPKEAQQEWSKIRNDEAASDPEKVEDWLRKWNVLTPPRQQRIEDMRWLIERHDIRDSEQYLRAHEAVPWD